MKMVCVVSLALGCASISPAALDAQLSSNAHVYASGLEGPRGLRFGPDGLLYVAEAGTGGTTSTTPGQCAQVIPPIGPYTNGRTSRISKIAADGTRTTVAAGFPSAIDSNKPAPDISGVGDLAFVNGTLYAVLSGAGCSHGEAEIPNSIVQVDTQTGKWKVVADLSTFLKNNPAKYPNAADFEPDGIFTSLISTGDRLYTVEPNHGQVISISPNGIAEETDISEAQGHIVPTSILERAGKFYVGNLGLFPITPDSSKILTLSRDWLFGLVPGIDLFPDLQTLKVTGSKAGFTTILAMAFGPDERLYALEFSAAAGYPSPGSGKVVRVDLDGSIEDVATGLSVPTGMTFGPDGALYVSNLGAAPPGAGEILRITVP